MGAIILATGIHQDPKVNSSIENAIAAAKKCIAQANIQAEDIDLLINTGVYRDQNTIEPGIVMLIQKRLGINLDYVKAGTGKAAFGFDLMNGGIGTLNAMKIADSFLQSDAARYVLIVSGETHPSQRNVEGFPYSTMGSAILIAKNTDPQRGFQGFSFRSKPHAKGGINGYLEFRNMGTDGRNLMTIERAPDYIAAARELAVRLCKDYLLEKKKPAKDFRLISSQLDLHFAQDLAKEVGFDPQSTLSLYESYGDVHSATFGLGFHQLTEKKLPKNSPVLFVGAAAGLDAGVVHYVS